jgi:uncharacterized lipoprotein YddW (UPF0748 family)
MTQIGQALIKEDMMKKIAIILTTLIFSFMLIMLAPKSSANTQTSSAAEKGEFRAAWASHLIGSMPAYTTEAQFKTRATEILDILEHYNFNALIMHMRTHNNAYYVSTLNPKAQAFSNVDFNVFDPMLWFIEETHKRGMEFHAWLNPYRLGTNYVGTMPAANPASNPANILTFNNASILNPGLPHVRDFISDTIVEILDRYPVDAIHFDDYFYTNLGANGSLTGSNTILNEPDQNTFVTYGAGFNTNSAASKADWRRHQVNLMVESVSDTIKDFNAANDTFVQFGISPTGIYKNGDGVVTYDANGHPITTGSETGGQTHYSSYLFADSVKWAQEGWIDYLIPQSYWADSHPIASYTKIMRWWNDVFKNLDVNLYSGIGLYMADSASNTYGWKSNMLEMRQQLQFIDTLEHVLGSSIYSYNFVDSAFKNANNLSTTQMRNAETQWSHIAVLPELRSMEPINPGIVSNLRHSNGILSFDGLADAKQYYIYRTNSDFTYSSSEIIKVVRSKDAVINYISNDLNDNYQYAVRAMSYTNTLGEAALMSDLNVINGAAIRKGTTETNQALRFYANVDPSIQTQSEGFFIVEGDATIAELRTRIQTANTNTFTMNGKTVHKITANNRAVDGTFSVVRPNIEPNKFSQVYTAIAYYEVGGQITLSRNLVVRSVLEVAYRMYYAGDADSQIESITEGIKLFGVDAFGTLSVTGKFENNHFYLREAFLNDWNLKFNSNLTSMTREVFFPEATFGKVPEIVSLAGSRLYQFFTDSQMLERWGWLLDYVEAIDTVVWPSRQVVALRGEGFNPDYANIWEGRHFITTLVGFFNGIYAYDGYPTNNFTTRDKYLELINYNNFIIARPEHLKYTYLGDQITLPPNAGQGFSHYLINDTIYQAGDLYTVTGNVVIYSVFG